MCPSSSISQNENIPKLYQETHIVQKSPKLFVPWWEAFVEWQTSRRRACIEKKKHYASHQIGMSQLFYSDGNIRRWLAYSSDTTGIKFFFQYRLDYYILSFKKELLTRNEQFSSNFLTNFSLQYKICKLNKVSHFFTECNKRQRQVSQLFIIFVKQLLIFHIHDSLI